MKRTLAVIITVIITFCLCSCEEKPAETALIYKSTAIGAPNEQWSRIVSAVFDGETLTLLTYVPGETFESGIQTEEYAVLTMNTDGEILSRHDLPRSEPNRKIIYYAANQSDDGVFYAIKTIAELENPDDLENVKATTELVQYDENFNETPLFNFDNVLGSSELWITDFTVKSGLLYFTSYTSSYTIDIKTAKVLSPTIDEDAVKTASKSAEIAALVSSSGIFDIRPAYYFELKNDEYIIIGDIVNGSGSKIYKAALVDPADLSDRIPVRFAVILPDRLHERLVADFNAQNAAYEVVIEKYYKSDGDFESASQQFNLDLVSGNAPDLVVTSALTNVPYESYAKKGVYADLMPYFNSDPELPLSAIVPSYAAANMTNGKMYSVAQSFEMTVLIGRESLLGSKNSWRFSELINLCNDNNIPYLLPKSTITQRTFILSFALSLTNSFIDIESGECYFDSPEFIELLEYAKVFPEAHTNEGSFGMSEIREGQALLNYPYGKGFRKMVFGEQQFGEPVSLVGYPNGLGTNGISAEPINEMSIISGAKNPDGAWEFIKFALTKGYIQRDDYGYEGSSFPVVTSRLDFQAEQMTKESYIDDVGERIENDGFDITSGGMTYDITPLTQADIDKVYEQINNITDITRTDTNLMTILIDDINDYLDGSKSAAETAAMIQNRASTYMAEIK
jgi:ABC-type glycerol-3-phosphate transport system substrate-binding protein